MRRLSLLLLLLASSRAAANTRIGNGGDTLGVVLEGTRKKIVDLLQLLDSEPRPLALRQASEACGRADALTERQRATCSEFLVDTIPGILALNAPERDPGGKVPFGWQFPEDGPLLVLENGVERPVDAVADPGDMGGIVFSYDSVRRIAASADGPAQLMALMYHEMGHKVLFRGAFTGDVEMVDELTGRALHDAAGAAVAELARRLNILTATFQVADTFSCVWTHPPFGAQSLPFIDRARVFDAANLSAYHAGFGYDILGRPAPERGLTVLADPRRAFLLRIDEPDACAASPEAAARRQTTVRYVEYDPLNVAATLVDLVPPLVLPGVNPLCQEAPEPVVLTGPGGEAFSCRVLFSLTR
jgi:hypothetical protein